jgi:hypothetical protein
LYLNESQQFCYAESGEMCQLKALEITKETRIRASTQVEVSCRAFLNEMISV